MGSDVGIAAVVACLLVSAAWLFRRTVRSRGQSKERQLAQNIQLERYPGFLLSVFLYLYITSIFHSDSIRRSGVLFIFGGGYRVNPECVTVACCARTRWIHSHITIYTIPYLLHAQDEDSILDHHRQTSTGVPSHSHFDHDQHCPPPLVLDASPHGLLPFGPQQSGDAHGESTDCAFCTVSQFHD